MHAQSLQLYPTLFNPMDHSQPGSTVHGILQARILEWVASRESPRPRDRTQVSLIADFVLAEPPGRERALLEKSFALQPELDGF